MRFPTRKAAFSALGPKSSPLRQAIINGITCKPHLDRRVIQRNGSAAGGASVPCAPNGIGGRGRAVATIMRRDRPTMGWIATRDFLCEWQGSLRTHATMIAIIDTVFSKKNGEAIVSRLIAPRHPFVPSSIASHRPSSSLTRMLSGCRIRSC